MRCWQGSGRPWPIPDEVRAAALLREAALISAEDSEEALAAVPLAPPGQPACRLRRRHGQAVLATRSRSRRRNDLRGHADRAARAGGGQRRRSWCTAARIAAAPTPTPRSPGWCSTASSRSPTARPSSRPSTVPVTLLPPVSHLEADVRPVRSLVLHWSAHPAAHEVRVIRTSEGERPAPVPVTGNSCQLTGLHRGPGRSTSKSWPLPGPGRRGDALSGGTDQGDTQIRGTAHPEVASAPGRSGGIRPGPGGLDAGGPLGGAHPAFRRAAPLAVRNVGTQEEMTRFGQEVTGRRVPSAQRDRHRG